MAVLLKVLVSTAICMAASQETCGTETKGGCNFIGCYDYRGPTDCVGSFPSKVCMCKPGYCTTADQSKCVEPGAAATAGFSVGDAVEVQDNTASVWTPGTVTSTNPLKVEPEGCTSNGGFRWGTVHHAAPTYKAGDAVETRDSDSDSWKPGTVTKAAADGVMVQPKGWKTSFTFAQVRALDWQKVAAHNADADKTRQMQFAAAAQKADADLAATHKSSVEAASAAKIAADEAAAMQKASEAAAAQFIDAEAEDKKRHGEATATAKAAQETSAKEQNAQQATETAQQALRAATDKASKEAAASEAAKEAAARKKTEVGAQQAQEAQESEVAATSLKQANDEKAKGNKPMASAMTAAYDQALKANNATHSLVLELQSQLKAAESRSAAAATASSDAQKDAVAKKGVLDAANHDGAQETRNAAKATQLADAARTAAASADAALQTAKQAAGAAKEGAEGAAAKQKDAEAYAHKLLAAERDATAQAEVAAAKSKCVSNMKSQIVLLQKAEPKQDDGTPMFLVVTCAAVVMVMGVAWHSARRGGSVVMPETLLG